MRVYWFRGRPNFGDALAPVLLDRFAGVRADWSHPALSDGVVIGSVAGRLPRRYYGVTLGIGKYGEDVPLDLSRAQVLGLRGPMTLRDSQARGNPVLGDSGLLAAELLGTRPPVSHDLGVVAHMKDGELAARYPDAHRIDVGRDPLDVIREIATCERIVSSSLHGLVTADAFGIPRCWQLSERVRGAAFKFRDYAAALGMPLEPDEWATAPASVVESVVSQLRDAFREIPARLDAEPRRAVHRAIQAADSVRGWLVSRVP